MCGRFSLRTSVKALADFFGLPDVPDLQPHFNVAPSPAFRGPFRHHRCLVAADGFYEWRREGKRKQPYFFALPHHQPFAFAGLWDSWEGDGEVIEGCTILTTDANEVVRSVHERMPVILDPKDWDLWLDPDEQDPKQLQQLLHPFAGAMTAYPVSTLVNSPQHEGPELVKPLK